MDSMRYTAMLAGVVAVSLLGTGCATKKYVAKTIAPLEQRETATEKKDADQDKTIASQGQEIQEMGQELSRTKEKLSDVDNKATQAGQTAQAAGQKADSAQQTANGARQAADNAKTFAENGINQLGKTIDGLNKFNLAKSETVLFPVNRWNLSPEAKDQLSGLAKQAAGIDRYVIEVQGFTDKTGSASYNDILSQRRAEEVARYLTNEYKIPVRNITMLGEGYAQPVADDHTRDGRKQNRRVEVKLWVPETNSAKAVPAGEQQ